MIIILPGFFLFFFSGMDAFGQTSYTWNGSNSSAWNNNLNWTPNTGFPGPLDNATINSSGFSPLLDMTRSVTNLTISSGTLNLNGFTLTTNGTCAFTSGTINNGTVNISTAGTCTFGGTTFGAIVSGSAASILFNGSIFNNTVSITKTGAANNASTGNNTFNSTTTITNNGTGYLRLSNTTRDIYNGDVTFTNTGTSFINPAYNDATGTQFNGNVVVNSTAGTGVQFGIGTGTSTLANTKTISIGGSGFTAGTLGLSKFTQSGGTSQSLTLTGTATLTVGPTSTFNGNVTFSSPQILLNGCTYNGTATLEKTGATANNSTGGNIFNGITTITNNGSAQLRLSNTTRDIFNSDVTFTNTGTSLIYPAYNDATGTQFNGNVVVNSTAGTGVQFGIGTGTSTLANTKTISIGGSGFTVGTLSLIGFTQTGATAQSLTLTGTAILTIGPSSTFNGNINFTSPQIFLNGCTYNGTAVLEKTGATTNISTGGNIFNGITTITNRGTAQLRLSNTTRDIFNSDVTFTNTGTNLIYPAYNDATGTLFNGNVIVNSTAGTGIQFGVGTGTSILANSKTISIGGSGFNTGTLGLHRFTQTGGTSQSLTLTGTATLTLGPSSTFDGNISFTSPQLLLNGCTFNGTATLEKNGASNNTSTGGNIFNGVTIIKNSGSGIMYLANATADDFNGSATFIRTGSGALNPAYNTNCTFSSDISTVGSTTAITFGGAASGRVTIDGSGIQNFYGDAGFPPTVSRLTMDGTGTLNLNVNVIISSNIVFTSGIINATTVSSTSTGLLILNNGITMSGASNTSYVNGYVRKIGNAAFTFPVGADGVHALISISAPTLATDHFTARYIKTNPRSIYDGSQKDLWINHISGCEYWILDRTNGVSNINVTLSWNSPRSCGVSNLFDMIVVRWNGSSWKDQGNGGTIGDITAGTIITSTPVSSFSPFTLASISSFNPLPLEILSFVGNCENGNVILKWRTAAETPRAYFTIERSFDGLIWQIIGRVEDAGSSFIRNYSFTDAESRNEISYYRIKYINFDGRSKSSIIVAVETCNKDLNELNIYSNPSKGKFLLAYNGDRTQVRSIEIYNVAGSKVYTSGGFQSTIDLTDKPSGIYYVHFNLKSKYILKKIVIERH